MVIQCTCPKMTCNAKMEMLPAVIQDDIGLFSCFTPPAIRTCDLWVKHTPPLVSVRHLATWPQRHLSIIVTRKGLVLERHTCRLEFWILGFYCFNYHIPKTDVKLSVKFHGTPVYLCYMFCL